MILSDVDIMAAVAKGQLGIHPYSPDMVQPASVDLRLDHHFRLMDDPDVPSIDPAREQKGLTRKVSVGTHEVFYLRPFEFALACTYETVSIPEGMCARLDGRSSLGRLGLLTHVTAGYIDPGFYGQITLELVNVAPLPIALYPGMKIAQLSLAFMASKPAHPYGSSGLNSHYQGQKGPTPSRSWVNFDLANTREGRHEWR